MSATDFYLPEGMPAPVAETDGLSAPYWEGLRQEELRVQRCHQCQTWQWGPEWICHMCHSFDLDWVTIEGTGRIYTWQRNWHPVHPALKERGPYLVVIVELPQAGNIRMIGNLLGDPMQPVRVGARVELAYEHHNEATPAFTLAQWRYAD